MNPVERIRALADLRRQADQRAAQPNPDGTYGQVPEGFVLNPQTGQYTTREMMTGNMQPSRAGAALAGGAHGITLGGVDEIMGGVGAMAGQGDYQRERARARIDAARRDFPGTTMASEIAGAVALPGVARTVRGATAIGAGMGAIYGALSSDGGAANRAQGAAIGGALGAAGGAASVPVSRAVSWAAQKFGRGVASVFRSDRLFRNGALTPEGRETIQALGYSADDVTEAFSRHFSRAVREGVEPQDAASIAAMRELRIPAYRHNVTGSAEDFAAFERARRGAIGRSAETRVRAAADRQDEAMRAAGERIAQGLGGGEVDQAGAAAMAQQGVRRAEEAARQTASEAYAALEAAGGGVRGTAVANMGQQLRSALRMGGVDVSPQLTPNAASAISDIGAMLRGTERGTVTFQQLERVRQNLVRLRSAANRGSLGADQRAMGELVSAFDRQVDDLMTTALTQGDDSVLALAQKARGLWASYKQTFQGDGAASRFIQRMADQDASPDDVTRWLFSSGKLGSGQFNSTLARGLRDVLGPDSVEWNAIRQAAFRQMTEKPEGMKQWGAAALANRIQEFLGAGTSRELSSELFSGPERALMNRYASALRRMEAPPGAVNYSGTAYENARMVRESFKAVSGMVGAATLGGGGVGMGAIGAGAGFLTAIAAGAARNAMRVQRTLSGRTPLAPANVAPGATGAAVGLTNALGPSLLQSGRPQ